MAACGFMAASRAMSSGVPPNPARSSRCAARSKLQSEAVIGARSSAHCAGPLPPRACSLAAMLIDLAVRGETDGSAMADTSDDGTEISPPMTPRIQAMDAIAISNSSRDSGAAPAVEHRVYTRHVGTPSPQRGEGGGEGV